MPWKAATLLEKSLKAWKLIKCGLLSDIARKQRDKEQTEVALIFHETRFCDTVQCGDISLGGRSILQLWCQVRRHLWWSIIANDDHCVHQNMQLGLGWLSSGLLTSRGTQGWTLWSPSCRRRTLLEKLQLSALASLNSWRGRWWLRWWGKRQRDGTSLGIDNR